MYLFVMRGKLNYVSFSTNCMYKVSRLLIVYEVDENRAQRHVRHDRV